METTTSEKLREKIELDIAYLRTVIDEPVSIKYGAHVDFEIRPDNDGDRLLVGRDGWGFTTVNYTDEGLIVDVLGEGSLEPVYTAALYAEDLEAEQESTSTEPASSTARAAGSFERKPLSDESE